MPSFITAVKLNACCHQFHDEGLNVITPGINDDYSSSGSSDE